MKLQADGYRGVLEHQNAINDLAIRQRAQAIFFAFDDRGNAEHASPIGASELVLEITGNHVADFAKRI